MARTFYGRVGMQLTDEITDNLVKLRGQVRRQVVDAVLAAAEVVRERAYDLANVSPGPVGHALDGRHMRDCIEVGLLETDTSVEARIGVNLSNVPYAAHQEFGPHGKPFIRPALDESRGECHDIMRAVLLDGVDASTLVRFRR